LSFRIDHQRERRSNPISREYLQAPETASKEDLLWYYFLGKASIATSDQVGSFSAELVPALHFVTAMLQARDLFAEDPTGRYVYNLTESDGQILLKRSDDFIAIESTFSSGVVATSLGDFSKEVSDFACREIRDLSADYPRLVTNSFVRDLKQRCHELSDDVCSD
jgi:hypothetical protein